MGTISSAAVRRNGSGLSGLGWSGGVGIGDGQRQGPEVESGRAGPVEVCQPPAVGREGPGAWTVRTIQQLLRISRAVAANPKKAHAGVEQDVSTIGRPYRRVRDAHER